MGWIHAWQGVLIFREGFLSEGMASKLGSFLLGSNSWEEALIASDHNRRIVFCSMNADDLISTAAPLFSQSVSLSLQSLKWSYNPYRQVSYDPHE